MPLLDAPNRGYADWQRVQNWDTGLLFQEINVGPINAPHLTPIMDVSRFAYISGWDQAINNPCVVSISWLSALTGGVSIATRQFVLNPAITNPAQYRLVNLGPYVQFQWTTVGSGSFNHYARLWATNRAHPLEFIPELPIALDVEGTPIAAGASSTQYPSDYFSGPIQVDFACTQVPNAIYMQSQNNIGTWVTIAGVVLTNTNDNTFQWIAPPPAVRFLVQNNSAAAAAFWLRVTPSPTGTD